MEPGGRSNSASAGDASRVTSARGALRDAVASLRNLEQLLQSVRVGPRAISSVLPAVHAGCASIGKSTRELLDALGEGEASRELWAYVSPRVDELERALTSAIPKPMYAKNRLRLEDVVRRVTGELDAALGLVDLAAEAAWGRSVRLDIVDLVRQVGTAEPRGPAVNVRLLASTPCEAPVNPRAVMGLVSVGVALVAGQSSDAVGVRVESQGAGGCMLTVEPTPESGEALAVETPKLVAPTLVAASLAAERAGARMTWEPARPRFRLEWPSGA